MRCGTVRLIAVALGGTQVDERVSSPDDGARRFAVLGVVEIPEHNQVEIRVSFEQGVDPFAEQEGFLFAQFRLVGLGNGPAGF